MFVENMCTIWIEKIHGIARMQIGKSDKWEKIVDVSVSQTKINIVENELYYLDKSTNASQTYQMYRVGVDGKKIKNIEY